MPSVCEVGERERGEGEGVDGGELAERGAGGDAGDTGDPRDEGLGGEVGELGDGSAGEAGEDAGGESPSGHGAGDGHGEEVGGQGDDGEAAEAGEEDGGDADLGGDGDGCGVAPPVGAGESVGQGAAEEDDAEGGAGGELEGDGVDQERVDEHEGGDGEGEDAQRPGGSAGEGGGDGDGGHGRGPQDRGLEPGEERERGDQRDGHGPAPPEPQPAQQRPGQHQHEGHVLARDDEHVGEAGGSEVVDDLGRLAAVVAEHEAAVEGSGRLGHRVGAVDEQRPEPVGRPPGPRPAVERFGPVDGEAPDDVAGYEPGRVGRRRGDPALDGEPFTGRRPTDGARRGAGGPQFQPLPVDADVDPDPEPSLGRIGQQSHRPVVAAALDRGQPRPGPVAQLRTEQEDGDAQQPGPPHRQRHGEPADPDRQRHRLVEPGTEHGEGGDRDRASVGQCATSLGRREGDLLRGERRRHPTVAIGRICSSLASPMPRTSRSSSTEPNRPCSSR